MRVAICDVRQELQDIFEKKITQYCKLRKIDISIDEFENGSSLLQSMNDREYDIIFMNCNVEDTYGIDISRRIKIRNKACVIIVVNTYTEASLECCNSLECCKINTFRFNVTPINEYQLFDVIDDCFKSKEYGKFLLLKTHNGAIKIKMSDIIYAEAKGKNTLIRTIKKTYEVHTHLKEIGTMLPPENFCRCQKAYIVGLYYVEFFTNKEIVFDNGERAQIGRKYLSEFKESFQDYVVWYNSRHI